MIPYELCIIRRDSVTGRFKTSTSDHAQLLAAIRAALIETRGLTDIVEITISMDAGNEGPCHYVYIGDALGPTLGPWYVKHKLARAWYELMPWYGLTNS